MTDLGGFGCGVAFAVIGVTVRLVLRSMFSAFSLYRLAQSRNVDMPWLAWIPIAQMYIIGKNGEIS